MCPPGPNFHPSVLDFTKTKRGVPKSQLSWWGRGYLTSLHVSVSSWRWWKIIRSNSKMRPLQTLTSSGAVKLYLLSSTQTKWKAGLHRSRCGKPAGRRDGSCGGVVRKSVFWMRIWSRTKRSSHQILKETSLETCMWNNNNVLSERSQVSGWMGGEVRGRHIIT